MERALRVVLVLAWLIAFTCPAVCAQAFSGTIFIDPDILTSSDPTTLVSITAAGRGTRTMFDRRVDRFIDLNAYLFNVRFSDGLTAEIQVNPEFGSAAAARAQADRFGPEIGRLPHVLRSNVRTVWIHRGMQPFGGGNNNILIHTAQADDYAASGILEETLIHEAAHTSLDDPHATSAGWLAAQRADPGFISDYARDNPTREDIAESFLPYFALRYRSDRITAALAATITAAIPNRITYFDAQSFNLFPVRGTLLPTACVAPGSLPSRDSVVVTSVEFINQSSATRQIYWLDYNGKPLLYATLLPGRSHVQSTFVSHPWMVANATGGCLGIYMPTRNPGRVILRD